MNQATVTTLPTTTNHQHKRLHHYLLQLAALWFAKHVLESTPDIVRHGLGLTSAGNSETPPKQLQFYYNQPSDHTAWYN